MQAKTKIAKSIFISLVKEQPYKLNFTITSACNSRCQTCNVWQVFKDDPNLVGNDLKLNEIRLIFKNLPNSIVWLSLSGGEPFLREDLFEICKAAVENISPLRLISIPSNGLLTEKILNTTKKILSLPLQNLFLNFSLDGPEPIHDQIRGIKGGFEKTWSTYEQILALFKNEPRLYANLETTISKYNIDYLEVFLKELVEDGHKITVTIAHTGYLYKNTSGNKGFTKLDHDLEKLNKILKIVKRSLGISPVDIIEKIYLEKILGFYKNPQKQPLPCIALKSSIALDSRGNLTPCFMWEKILGNTKDYNYNLKQFFKQEKYEVEKIRNLIKKEKCPNCWTPCEAYQSIINGLFSRQLPQAIKSLINS